jgi:hypothetical protein
LFLDRLHVQNSTFIVRQKLALAFGVQSNMIKSNRIAALVVFLHLP